VELAICGEGIWTTKGANPRERHETGHLVNGIDVGDSVERGAYSVRLRWHSNYLHLELSFDDKLARCQQII